MSPSSISSPKKMNSLRRWNSILGSEHRRSQSLNAVHKSSSVEAMRSSTSLGTFRPRDDEQSSILTASTNADPIVEEEFNNDDQVVSISPSRSTHSRQSFNTSPPPRPKPAPRLWSEAPQSSASSLKGLETAIAPNHVLSASQNPLQIVTSPLSSSPVPESPRSPKSLVSKFSTWKEKSFAGRRKGSVPDLELGSEKKSFNPDSPTLPPIHSARTESTIMTHGSLTPRPFTNGPDSSDTINYAALRTPEWQERDQRRASSMLLPHSLAPIVVPSAPARIPPVPPIDTTMVRTQADEERPPRPPPKSPRTLLRAFPIPKSAVLPGRHTANSSITSISPIETPSTAATAWSPVSIYSATAVQSPDSFVRSPSKNNNTVTFEETPRTASFVQSFKVVPTMKHGRSTSNSVSENRAVRKTTSPALGNHSRMVSDTSVMNRGRPMKRNDVAAPRFTTRGAKVDQIKGQFEDLPQGLRKSLAGYIPVDELHGLRRDAEELTSGCNILTQKQIVGLNQEQQILDDNCDQMQHTISGLKEARKATYLSLKLFLEAPGATNSMRDYIMKQTKNLNDLDTQIDDLQSKLNAANDRKAAIQSKVWEHLTAILTAVSLAAEVGRPEEYTPPRSPERLVRQSLIEDPIKEDGIVNDIEYMARNEVESITVFADSGVASLLRSIEEELDVIDHSRYYGGEVMV